MVPIPFQNGEPIICKRLELHWLDNYLKKQKIIILIEQNSQIIHNGNTKNYKEAFIGAISSNTNYYFLDYAGHIIGVYDLRN